ncbi:MAG TPA: hypothetical protein PK593_05855 [Thermomicrobiales bacterium]|jgi:hypothetical protein|nr:hypothetical protein [Chloroflexota bacterium]HCG29307.1 hypothetical protein [Chloroflexota bacterium]HQX62967.1 hypothetical protein [Thermomicrobiales bacterium]HQZ90019.1 hypothetical protein [Thermomicrobiales bacterium]HRA32009.1 hypothetical protein [Thermomicrobiales bacterium]
MRIVIEIDEPRTPAPAEISVTRTGPAASATTEAPVELGAISAGPAAPLAGGGGETAPEMSTDEVAGALSAGAAPVPTDAG